jgi:hypothetical protein
MAKKLTCWWYHIPVNFALYKTAEKFTNKKSAIDIIKATWGIKRLPSGFEMGREGQ